MKNLIIFCLLLVSTVSYTQNLKLNLIGSGEYSTFEYTYIGSFVGEHIDREAPLGYSVSLQLEYDFHRKFSINSGITYREKNFYPRLALGGVYGAIEDPTGNLNNIQFPYLHQHSFRLISIPLVIKYYPLQNTIIKPFVGLGFDTEFQFSEKEVFKPLYEDFRPITIPEVFAISMADDKVSYFGTTLKLELGMTIKLTEKFSFVFDTQLGLWEFRRANEKFKKNGTYLYQDAFLHNSLIAAGLGMQYRF